jgi:hypothetical protein
MPPTKMSVSIVLDKHCQSFAPVHEESQLPCPGRMQAGIPKKAWTPSASKGPKASRLSNCLEPLFTLSSALPEKQLLKQELKD